MVLRGMCRWKRIGNEIGQVLRRLVIGRALQADLDVGFGHAFDVVAKFGRDEFRRIGVDALRDRCHDAHLHQRLDDFGTALGHAAGQLLNGDGFGNDNIADDLLRRRVQAERTFAFALLLAPKGGVATLPRTVFIAEGLADRQLAVAAPGFATARRW